MQQNDPYTPVSSGSRDGFTDCAESDLGDSAPPVRPAGNGRARARCRALSLVEVMVALTLMATVMMGFIATFLQSRRLTESSVLHAAASSLVYGVIEQIKGLDYTRLLPSTEIDDDAPKEIKDFPPYVRLRINQDLTVWLRVVYTDKDSKPKGPTAVPASTVSAKELGAIDNFLGNLPLSTVTGTASQDLSLNLWIWIDEIPNVKWDVADVKKITVVYTYSYLDGNVERVVRSREVFLRTQYDK